MFKKTDFLAFSLIIISLFLLFSCGSRGKFRECNGVVWSTSFHIIYESDKDLRDSIFVTFNEVENSVSMFKKGSVVARVNNNEEIDVDTHFINVYEMSCRVNSLSEGMFDPTLAPLINAWGFGKGHAATSDTLRLDSLLQLVGIKKTQLVGRKLIKENPDIEFNFSAIAKGYGVDCVSDMLRRNGVENFLVEVGGEIMTAGRNREGLKWNIAIEKPELEESDMPREAVVILSLTDLGVATSGNYRNYHKSTSGTYGHTISPATGRPIQKDVISATVIANSAMEADAIATTAMVIGSKKAINLCDSLNLGVMLVLRDFSTLSNGHFNSLISTHK